MPAETGKPLPKPQEGTDDPCASKNDRDWHDKTSLLVWGATLLAAVAAAVFTGRQAYLANKQLQVARGALAITQDTEKRQLRAYVGTIPGTIENLGDAAKQRFTLTVKNFGITPAYDVGSLISYNSTYKDISVIVGPECGTPALPQLVSLFPGGEFKFRFDGISHAIAKEEFADVLKETLRYAYWGTICYLDAFGKMHYTNYCWFWSGKALISENAEGCPQHNDSN